MMRRLFKDIFKSDLKNIAKQEVFDFKGKRIDLQSGIKSVSLNKEEVLENVEIGYKMQPRIVRLKNIGYMSVYILWYVLAIGFIMHRMRGNEILELEEEINKTKKN